MEFESRLLETPFTPSGTTGMRKKRSKLHGLKLAKAADRKPTSIAGNSLALKKVPFSTMSDRVFRDCSSGHWSIEGSPVGSAASMVPKDEATLHLEQLSFEPPHSNPQLCNENVSKSQVVIETPLKKVSKGQKKVLKTAPVGTRGTATTTTSAATTMPTELTKEVSGTMPQSHSDILAEISLINETIRALKRKRRELLNSNEVPFWQGVFPWKR